MFGSGENYQQPAKGILEQPFKTRHCSFRRGWQWVRGVPDHDEYSPLTIPRYRTSLTLRPDGNRINQGIAEKLFTAVAGISMFFAAYVVALAKQWKLALIAMSILPAIFLTVGVALSLDAPLEAKVVSLHFFSILRSNALTHPSLFRSNSILELQRSHTMLSRPSKVSTPLVQSTRSSNGTTAS